MSGVSQREPVKLSSLLLDDENFRLPEGKLRQVQKKLLKELWDFHEAEEIAVSVQAGGFGEEDPVVVVESKKDPGFYVVIEGNRRVAALKVLSDKESQKLVGYEPEKEFVLQNGEIEVLKFNSKDDTWRYVGRRHIKGPKKWDSVSKARFIFDTHERLKVPLDDIALQLGDTDRTAARLYFGYKVLKQAKEESIFDYTNIERMKFSHLYTSLEKWQVLDFLGTTQEELKSQSKPIPARRVPQLRKLFSLIYGDKKKKGVVESQNPDLKKLAICLTQPDFVERLERTRSLDATLKYVLKNKPEALDAEDRKSLRQMGQKKNKFFQGMVCPVKNDRMETLISEISRINWKSFPTASACLLRALLEVLVDYSIKHAKLTHELHEAHTAELLKRGGKAGREETRTGLGFNWDFMIKNRSKIFITRVADSLTAIGSDQKLLQLFVHTSIKADSSEVERMGTKVRFLAEGIMDGSAFREAA